MVQDHPLAPPMAYLETPPSTPVVSGDHGRPPYQRSGFRPKDQPRGPRRKDRAMRRSHPTPDNNDGCPVRLQPLPIQDAVPD